ncbi:MAG: hypothetical protein IK000_08185 [Bacteroidaceae bacterium]|nr:hypothetical protein [Bacteroidaceae bacterium]
MDFSTPTCLKKSGKRATEPETPLLAAVFREKGLGGTPLPHEGKSVRRNNKTPSSDVINNKNEQKEKPKK